MAFELSREARSGIGSRDYRFQFRRDFAAERKLFEAGQKCENARFHKGSLAQKIFDRMSSTCTDHATHKIEDE